MQKKIICFFLAFLLIASTLPSFAEEIPEWLKRTSLGLRVETDQKPYVFLETVQPLYQSDDKVHTVFTHDRISIEDYREAYSAGLGYRQLMMNERLLAGINTFFDYESKHRHYRQGLGFEAIGKVMEARANAYFAMSPKRRYENSSSQAVYARAANGGDVEIGAPLPYLPWAKLFASYYHYDFKKSGDMNGWKARCELTPFENMTINLITYDDNKGNQEFSAEMRLSFAFRDLTLEGILSDLKPKDTAFKDVDLRDRTLERVERNFEIQVESWREVAGATIQIGRK